MKLLPGPRIRFTVRKADEDCSWPKSTEVGLFGCLLDFKLEAVTVEFKTETHIMVESKERREVGIRPQAGAERADGMTEKFWLQWTRVLPDDGDPCQRGPGSYRSQHYQRQCSK